MFDWPALLRRPDDYNFTVWFERIANRLLFGSRLMANGTPLRLIEVEAYYHGPGHEDPFVHRDPVQLTPGRWYFHRTGGQYRGGSFKGLDLAFGEAATNSYAGMLIRGVELPDGTMIDGPSLTVDQLLKLTGHSSVKTLDQAINGLLAWESGPLRLVTSPGSSRGLTAKCLRVGLTLKKRKYTSDDPAFQFLFRHYRYLSEPKRTQKGKPHMVLPGIASEDQPYELQETTGCPLAAIRRYAAYFTAGRMLSSAEPFYGRELTTVHLCKLYGLWVNLFGNR